MCPTGDGAHPLRQPDARLTSCSGGADHVGEFVESGDCDAGERTLGRFAEVGVVRDEGVRLGDDEAVGELVVVGIPRHELELEIRFGVDDVPGIGQHLEEEVRSRGRGPFGQDFFVFEKYLRRNAKLEGAVEESPEQEMIRSPRAENLQKRIRVEDDAERIHVARRR